MGYKGEDKSRVLLARLTNFSFCREPHWEPVHWLISFHCGSVANSSVSYFAQAQQASSRSAWHQSAPNEIKHRVYDLPRRTEFSKNAVLRRHYSKSWKLRGLNFTIFTRKNLTMQIKYRERDRNTAFSHARPTYRFYFSPSRLYPTWEPVHRLSKISFECHVFLVLTIRRKQ